MWEKARYVGVFFGKGCQVNNLNKTFFRFSFLELIVDFSQDVFS